jgi:predicted DNA-binding transcriptional regulator AlpA
MTLRENEITHRKHGPERLEHRDKVLSFAAWCAVNGFSKSTGHRLLRTGEGPPVLQLSARRIGIRESDNRTWQASRARGAKAA